MRRVAPVLACAVALAACSPAEAPDPRPVVAVSVVPQQYFVERIAGDRVRVLVMIPPGANEASYEPTLAQVRALSGALLYWAVGHPSFAFERAWLDRILADVRSLPVVDGSAGLDTRAGDPHVWVAPRHAERMAIGIARALGERLPAERAFFEANLAGFREEIASLDAEIRAILAPMRVRSFLVVHPAFGYFAADYGLEQLAIEHEHKTPDAHQLAALLERARALGLRVVYVQPQFDAAPARTFAREIGARVETLDPLAYDWPGNLRAIARQLAAGAPE